MNDDRVSWPSQSFFVFAFVCLWGWGLACSPNGDIQEKNQEGRQRDESIQPEADASVDTSPPVEKESSQEQREIERFKETNTSQEQRKEHTHETHQEDFQEYTPESVDAHVELNVPDSLIESEVESISEREPNIEKSTQESVFEGSPPEPTPFVGKVVLRVSTSVTTDQPAKKLFVSLQSAVNYAKSIVTLHSTISAVEIVLSGGVYRPKQSVFVDWSKSNPPLTIRSSTGSSQPAILSGAVELPALVWSVTPNRTHVVQARITGFTKLGLSANRLFVSDGSSLVRSRYPNTGFISIEKTCVSFAIERSFYIKPPNSADIKTIQTLKNTKKDIEIVAFQAFRAPRVQLEDIRNVTGQSDTFLLITRSPAPHRPFAKTCPQSNKDLFLSDGYRFFFENISAAHVDMPGEWHIDVDANGDAMLYYHLRSHQRLQSGQIVGTGQATPLSFRMVREDFTHQPLLRIGSPTQWSENVQINDLVFQETGWRLPNNMGKIGYVGAQAISPPSSAKDSTLEGTMLGVYCNGCQLFANTLLRAGGRSAMHVYGEKNRIIFNTIRDAGGNAIVLADRFEGESLFTASTFAPLTTPTKDNEVTDNTIERVGGLHAEGAGILGFISSGNFIEYNKIHDVAYAGISFGWDWSDKTATGANFIRFNHIAQAGRRLNDVGGIYIVGRQSKKPTCLTMRSQINGNLIENIRIFEQQVDTAIHGIYMDRGSNAFQVVGNRIQNTEGDLIKAARTSYVRFEKNVLIDSDVRKKSQMLFFPASDCSSCIAGVDIDIVDNIFVTNDRWDVSVKGSATAIRINDATCKGHIISNNNKFFNLPSTLIQGAPFSSSSGCAFGLVKSYNTKSQTLQGGLSSPLLTPAETPAHGWGPRPKNQLVQNGKLYVQKSTGATMCP